MVCVKCEKMCLLRGLLGGVLLYTHDCMVSSHVQVVVLIVTSTRQLKLLQAVD